MENKLVTLSGIWSIVKDPENTGIQAGLASAVPQNEITSIRIPEHIPNAEWTMQ